MIEEKTLRFWDLSEMRILKPVEVANIVSSYVYVWVVLDTEALFAEAAKYFRSEKASHWAIAFH